MGLEQLIQETAQTSGADSAARAYRACASATTAGRPMTSVSRR